MTVPSPLLIPIGGHTPVVDPTAWIAPGVVLSGRVDIAADAGIWFGAVLRGDGDRITVGVAANLQEGVTIHADPGMPVTIGDRVSVGHRAVLHGCTIGDGALIGMSATVLDTAEIGAGSLVAAGAVVAGNLEIPPGSLVAGVPAKVRRSLTDEECAFLQHNADDYVRHAHEHREALAHLQVS